MNRQFSPRKVYVAASWMAPVGRYTGTELEKLSFLQMAAKASAVFSDTSIKQKDIEAVVVGSQNPGAFSGVDNTAAKIAGVLGISGAKSVLIDTASSSGASAVEYAYLQIASGRCDHVIALGIQKMSDADTLEATRIVAGVIDRDEAEYGLSMPACGALVARSLIERLKLTPDEWTAFSALLTQRAHRFAAKNPHAHLKYEIPVAEYYRQIASGKNYLYWSPLRLHDFCPMSDGVACVVLTSKPHEVMIAGVGSATDIPTIADRLYFHSFPATVRAAAEAYGMAGIKDIRSFAGEIHVNMHDPFNGFGPINMVDLGLVPKTKLVAALLDDAITGEKGMFPTNLTGGLKGRGHPLGATGMIQVVENHQMLLSRRFKAGLSHSIGGPINNNVVILLERRESYNARSPKSFKPWGLPSLGALKPESACLDRIVGDKGIEGTFVISTTRFHHKSGEPLNSIILISCRTGSGKFKFLLGIDGEHHNSVRDLKKGDSVLVERSGDTFLINSIPAKRLYQRTIDGLVEMAGSGWRKIRGRKSSENSP
ncbi:MAG: thiolase family protein [Geobacteraceae bacterium]|nr:thiolase family protein [Geobacteraceae bacterium]